MTNDSADAPTRRVSDAEISAISCLRGLLAMPGDHFQVERNTLGDALREVDADHNVNQERIAKQEALLARCREALENTIDIIASFGLSERYGSNTDDDIETAEGVLRDLRAYEASPTERADG